MRIKKKKTKQKFLSDAIQIIKNKKKNKKNEKKHRRKK